MTSKGVDHWVSSPYCFCKDLPWLVLSGLPASPALLGGGWGWEDWAILAASLIALAFLLFLLFLLCCLLCPPGFCCRYCRRKGCCGPCCAGAGGAGASAAGVGKKEKKGLAGGQALEMSSIGGSDESNLTAVDMKLPRAWMDSSKGDIMTDDRGDLGLGTGGGGGGGGSYFGSGNQHNRAWTSANLVGDRVGGGAGDAALTRSANLGVHLHGRSAAHGGARQQGPYDVDSVDGLGAEDSSARADFYRNQSTTAITTVIAPSPNIGEHIREAVQEWQKKSGLVSQKLEENRQQLNDSIQQDVKARECPHCAHHSVHHSAGCQHCQHLTATAARHAPPCNTVTKGQQDAAFGYSTLKETAQHESRYEEDRKSSSMALVKSSASASASGSGAENALTTTSDGSGGGSPILQCYTVTKKTTTTTYGDEEGDEETSVVTTTEKQWREGMNEVGEVSVAAAATVGELLPSIGAPAHVMNDVSNVRTVRSMTNVEGGVSNVVRRYEFQQTMNDTETLL